MTKEELDKEAYQYDAEHLRNGRGARWYHNVTIKEAYLAGAEPREKRIVELENKVRFMGKQIDNLKGIISLRNKENAELKDKYDSCLRENTGLKIHNTYVEKKLTKAKKIIGELLASCFSYNSKMVNYEVKAKAEQFLKKE